MERKNFTQLATNKAKEFVEEILFLSTERADSPYKSGDGMAPVASPT
jgi:hypothetical protein